MRRKKKNWNIGKNGRSLTPVEREAMSPRLEQLRKSVSEGRERQLKFWQQLKNGMVMPFIFVKFDLKCALLQNIIMFYFFLANGNSATADSIGNGTKVQTHSGIEETKELDAE